MQRTIVIVVPPQFAISEEITSQCDNVHHSVLPYCDFRKSAPNCISRMSLNSSHQPESLCKRWTRYSVSSQRLSYPYSIP